MFYSLKIALTAISAGFYSILQNKFFRKLW
jgi:hypothetical protein